MKLPPGARLLFLLALAAALRIAWASRVGPVEFLQIDGREYREIAEHLARGDGYAIASPRWFEPAALLPGGPRPDCYRPPLLPLLGAPLFLLPGHWEIWARALMILLGTAPVPLLWVLGRRIGEPRAGRIGAALMAVHPYAIYYAGYWSTETPFLLLILGTATLLARRGEGRAGARDAICAGLLAGAAALARPTGLVLIPLFAGAMAMDGRLRVSRGSLRLAGLFLAAAALCLAPWTVRNVAVAGVPHPGTFFGPYNRWLGHND